MAKKKSKTKIAPTRRPRTQPLPGMEDRVIKPLEDVAADYADIRDTRIELAAREQALKIDALQLMKKFNKTIYRHDGIEIAIIPGEDDVKVKVKKAVDDDDDVQAPHTEFAADRHAAVAGDRE
jgi:hypothetical protein